MAKTGGGKPAGGNGAGSKTGGAKRTVGVQTIIFGKRMGTDLAGVLRDVAAAGYGAVETGYIKEVPGREFKKMLADNGLVHVGAHWGGPNLADIGPVIDWLKETGGTEIPVSDPRPRDNPAMAVYAQMVDEYAAAGAKCAAAGLNLSYHNHYWEIAKVDGQVPLDFLFDRTDPKLVKACLDTYWVRDGGEDPAAYVAKYASRLRILHCKDSFLEERSQRSFCPVGGGVLDFPSIFQALAPSPCPWVVVEQDFPRQGETAAEASAASRRYLKEVIKI